MFSLKEGNLWIATGKLLDLRFQSCTQQSEWVLILRALLRGAAGSWYLSTVRNGLFEALLKKTQTVTQVLVIKPNYHLKCCFQFSKWSIWCHQLSWWSLHRPQGSRRGGSRIYQPLQPGSLLGHLFYTVNFLGKLSFEKDLWVEKMFANLWIKGKTFNHGAGEYLFCNWEENQAGSLVLFVARCGHFCPISWPVAP